MATEPTLEISTKDVINLTLHLPDLVPTDILAISFDTQINDSFKADAPIGQLTPVRESTTDINIKLKLTPKAMKRYEQFKVMQAKANLNYQLVDIE